MITSVSRVSPKVSNRALKREVAKAIAEDRFEKQQQTTLTKFNPSFKSGSYVTVKPRAKVTRPQDCLRYNHGNYKTYSTNNRIWLWSDSKNNW